MLLSLSVAVTTTAQTTGSIDGAVVDANGNPRPGVVVTVAGPGVRQEHVTGVDGAYTAAGLAAGDYVVTAVLPGFETAEAPVSVRAGATASIRDDREPEGGPERQLHLVIGLRALFLQSPQATEEPDRVQHQAEHIHELQHEIEKGLVGEHGIDGDDIDHQDAQDRNHPQGRMTQA